MRFGKEDKKNGFTQLLEEFNKKLGIGGDKPYVTVLGERLFSEMKRIREILERDVLNIEDEDTAVARLRALTYALGIEQIFPIGDRETMSEVLSRKSTQLEYLLTTMLYATAIGAGFLNADYKLFSIAELSALFILRSMDVLKTLVRTILMEVLREDESLRDVVEKRLEFLDVLHRDISRIVQKRLEEYMESAGLRLKVV